MRFRASLTPGWRRSIKIPLAIGMVGCAVTAVALAVSPRAVAFAYLAAFASGVTTALGALFFIMIANTARARWFVAIRRTTEAVAATLPLFAILFIPVAISVGTLYPWMHPEAFHEEEVRHALLHQRVWMNEPFFLIRAVIYFAVWIAMSEMLRSASVKNDADPDPALVLRQRWISAAGLPVLALTATSAGFDWVMSLEPAWVSDMYGVLFFVGGLAAAVSSTAVVAYFALRAALLPPELSAAHFHALGRVMFMTVVFWTYINFAQLLLVWIANLPREVSFYAARSSGGWAVVCLVLFFGHFIIPFFLLLSRPLKRRPDVLAAIGAWIVLMHTVDLYWQVVPGHGGKGHALDPFAVVGVAGLAIAFGAWRFCTVPPAPVNDPDLAQSLRYESP